MGETVVVVIALGAYYAATDGVLMALASSMLPEASRATGLSLIVSATSIGRLFASIAFGAAVDARRRRHRARRLRRGADLRGRRLGARLQPPAGTCRRNRVGVSPARAAIFAVVVLCCFAGAAASVALAVVRAAPVAPARGRSHPHGLVARGSAGPAAALPERDHRQDFGKLAVAPLADPDHVRAVTDLSCDRVYYAARQRALPDGDELVREQLRGEDLRRRLPRHARR